MTTISEHDLSFQLNAIAVDSESGIIRGATVAQAGVEAIGKFVMLDANGNLTRDPELAVRKLQVVTDSTTLDSLMTAAEQAGGVLKIRSDHDDSLQARAGFADNFRKVENRVVCDLHLNKSYRDRDIVLETANSTPKLIGLSIDMTPNFELTKTSALMRISELLAVDIVDAGAITHDGLFLSRGVDSKSKIKVSEQISPNTKMVKADKTPPTVEECMALLQTLSTTVAELRASAGADKSKEAMSAVEGLRTELAAVKENQVKLSQEKAALGIKPEDAAVLKAMADAETERVRLAAEADKNKPKTYLELVEAKFAEGAGKLKKSECHSLIMASDKKAYALHLAASGVAAK